MDNCSYTMYCRQELCPEMRILFYPNLPKIIGSDFLEVCIRSIQGAEGSACACICFVIPVSVGIPCLMVSGIIFLLKSNGD